MILVVVTILLASDSGFLSATPIQLPQADAPVTLSDSDKAEIIRLILEQRLKADGEDAFREYLLLASDNIKPSMVPKIRDFHIKLARTKDLKRKAKENA